MLLHCHKRDCTVVMAFALHTIGSISHLVSQSCQERSPYRESGISRVYLQVCSQNQVNKLIIKFKIDLNNSNFTYVFIVYFCGMLPNSSRTYSKHLPCYDITYFQICRSSGVCKQPSSNSTCLIG